MRLMDAVALPFDVERLGDAADEELGGAVVGEFGLTVVRRRGRQIDDDRVVRIAKVRERRVQSVDDALGIDVDLLEVPDIDVLKIASNRMPALLIIKSSRPVAFANSLTRCAISAESVTSRCPVIVVPPSSSISSASDFRPTSSMS
jgi:hypothetical protein